VKTGIMLKKNQNASLIFHIIRFSETIRKHGDVMTQKYGITTQQWLILLLLAKDPNIIYLQEHPQEKPMLAKELADAMNVSRANITNLLNVLIQKKLIAQVEDAIDKRRKRLVLTKQGERTVMELEEPRHKRNQRLFQGFSREEKDAVISFIKKSLSVLKRDMAK
jgi:DNA-binding MarR family transcriptional regulator